VYPIFSDNFIVLDANHSVKDTFDVIEELSPNYVIVSRQAGDEHYHYVFLTEFLKNYLNSLGPNEDLYSTTLIDVLYLHEYHGDFTFTSQVSIPDPITDPQLEEISSLASSGQFTVLTHNDKILGIMDPIKGDENANYEIKGVGYQVSSSTFQDELASLPEEPARDLESASRIRRGGGVAMRGGDEDVVMRGADEDVVMRGAEEVERVMKGDTHVVKKYATATLPNSIPVKQPAAFEIVLKHSKPVNGQSTGMDLTVDKGKKVTSLTVIAKSDPPDYIEFTDGYVKEMKVPLEKKDSSPLVFVIKPIKEGWCTVKAQFYHKGNYAGEIGVKTKITSVRARSQPTSVTSSMDMDTQKEGADLSLHIREISSNAGLKYEIIVQSLKLGFPIRIFKPNPLRGDPEKYFRAIFDDIEDFGGPNFNPQIMEDNIASKGRNLYSELFPQDLQQFFWDNRNEIKSIQVISQEPWIPWEIIKPWTNSNDGPQEEGFLCEKYAFTRWLDDIQIQQKSTIEQINVVLPNDTNLDGARTEFRWIKQFAREVNVNVTHDSKYKEVMKSLHEGGFDLLHFTTHGLYEKKYANMSEVELEKGMPLRPENISGNATNFGKEHPLVILNACQTGQQGFALTGIGSWAKSFLKAKAFGFIGTLWSVSDSTALNFTKSLFTNIHNKIPLDVAVQSARLDAKERGDPSWLAYTLYAPANTSITLGN